ncbi:MAG: hypothetical protein EOO90_06925 [Pedobacter sp.]|nr:MAG: hypothetical protein EOO90_06925 [Pedobacter sp.]
MNSKILSKEVQDYIEANLQADVAKIALSKPLFDGVSSAELAAQIAAKKKSAQKLPTWYKTDNIYYPALLSIEQCSSEHTAAYKAGLALGDTLIDITSGFGVDSLFFSKRMKKVTSCELNPELSSIAAHNAKKFGMDNIECKAGDGIEILKANDTNFDTLYIDPARRSGSNKVFKLNDCTPDVTNHLNLFLKKAKRVIIKSAPLLDISVGISELKNIKEIHVVSVKNECKELIWVIDEGFIGDTKVVCITLNDIEKTFSFYLNELQVAANISNETPNGYLYEPDVALLKSGAFNLISQRFDLKKLHLHSHLYFSNELKSNFPGRVFEIQTVTTPNKLGKEKSLQGNVIVRNFPEKAENLVKKYKIKPTHDDFIIFTQNENGNLVIIGKIIQHY